MGVEETERGSFFYKDVLPFAAMVLVELMVVSGNTLYKSASANGINSYVFTFYVFFIGFIFILPLPFILHRYLPCNFHPSFLHQTINWWSIIIWGFWIYQTLMNFVAEEQAFQFHPSISRLLGKYSCLVSSCKLLWIHKSQFTPAIWVYRSA